MNNLMFMHILKSLSDFSRNDWNSFLSKFLFFLHEIKQLTITAKFHQQINIVWIREISVEFDQIRMIQEHLNLDLSDQLVYHLGLLFWLQAINVDFSDNF